MNLGSKFNQNPIPQRQFFRSKVPQIIGLEMSIYNSDSSLPYQVIDHSSDLMIRAYGHDFLEALANASSALAAIAVRSSSPGESEERAICIEGLDEAERAIAFLNEILYLIYSRLWLPHRVRRLTVCSSRGCRTLEAVLAGEPVDSQRHAFRYDIKAVTYHDFAVLRDGDRTMIQFVCDL